MKISKQILLITPILFLFFASGCSKNLLHLDGTEPLQPKEEIGAEVDTSTAPDKDFDSTQQGMPGNGSAGSFSAEPFTGASPEAGSKLSKEGIAGDVDSLSPLYEKPDPRSFGSAQLGMPGNGSAGSFSADPFTGSSPEPHSGLSKEGIAGDVDSLSPLYEKPDPRSFGSAQLGMPGNGSTGSFSADPFTGSGPKPHSEFFREESVGEMDTPSHPYEKPDPRRFGSAEQGMPGDGATGSFSAEPFIDESGVVAQLPLDEKVRRKLPYGPTDRLQDIHFAFDMFDLDDQAKATLQKNAAYLNAHPNSRIEIQGHCDERGSNNYNITLGQRRVQSTQSYLVSLGVDDSRIHTISYGEERPFCFESNEKCWYQNRRGHFLVAE